MSSWKNRQCRVLGNTPLWDLLSKRLWLILNVCGSKLQNMLVRCSIINCTLFLKVLDLMTLRCQAMTTYSINGHITTSASQRRAAMAGYNCKILNLGCPAGRGGISANFHRYPIFVFSWYPIFYIRYCISVNPSRYLISDIWPEPISNIRYPIFYRYYNPKILGMPISDIWYLISISDECHPIPISYMPPLPAGYSSPPQCAVACVQSPECAGYGIYIATHRCFLYGENIDGIVGFPLFQLDGWYSKKLGKISFCIQHQWSIEIVFLNLCVLA